MERLNKYLEGVGYDSFPPYEDQLGGVVFDFFKGKERITVIRDSYTSYQVLSNIQKNLKDAYFINISEVEKYVQEIA